MLSTWFGFVDIRRFFMTHSSFLVGTTGFILNSMPRPMKYRAPAKLQKKMHPPPANKKYNYPITTNCALGSLACHCACLSVAVAILHKVSRLILCVQRSYILYIVVA